MDKENKIAVFDNKQIRRLYDEKEEVWYFSVIDIVEVLTESSNPRDYWFKMKQRVQTEDGFELSTVCRQFKLKAADGKQRTTDVANVEGVFRIIQSIPSPKAEPFKQWLAELSTRQIAESEQAKGLNENAKAGVKGGSIAKNARKELEAKTGKSVVTGDNFLPPKKENN